MSGIPSDPPPSFKGELYYLMAKFLEVGPCQQTAQTLKNELNTLSLLPPRYDWMGRPHPKTFRDLEEEFGKVPPEYLLRLCFDLCTTNPAVPSVRSLLSHARLQAKATARQKLSLSTIRPHIDLGNPMQHIHNARLGMAPTPRIWHERHLVKQIRKLRTTLGHLSSVYCLTFDRTGKLAFTGADDLLVKCWNVSDGRLLYTFRGGASEISDMTVSHDNRLLAVATLDKLARIWNIHTGEPVAVLSRHSGTLTAINFSAYVSSDGYSFLVCTSGDGTASFWRYRYGKGKKVEFDEQPTRYHEKSRPGKAKIICATFSPGGIFFCTGSADHNVRVYQMNCAEGPQRILEDDMHDDQVDSIQWCNNPSSGLRFVTGSSDGTARVWTFKSMKWTSIVLNMMTGDNTVPGASNQQNSQPERRPAPPPAAVVQQPVNNGPSTRNGRSSGHLAGDRRDGRTMRRAAIAAASANSRRNSEEVEEGPTQSEPQPTNGGQDFAVTMVQWSADDKYIVTAVADFDLRIWNSTSGQLVSKLCGHTSLVYTLEPHPISGNILMSAGHDGNLKIWDLTTSKALFEFRNFIDMQGHASVYDAKWSPDGTTICATDSHGHLLFFGHGSSDKYDKNPNELFFHTDFRPLLRDSFHNVVDEQTQMLPHLMPPPLLIDSEGAPYPPDIQRLVRGRERSSNVDALLPINGPARNNANPNAAPEANEENVQRQLPAQIARHNQLDNLVSQDSNGPATPPEHRSDDNSGPENRLDGDQDNPQPGPSRRINNFVGRIQPNEPSTVRASSYKLLILNEELDRKEIEEKLLDFKARAALEYATFVSESQKASTDHDYTSKVKAKKQKAKAARREQQNAEQEDDEEEEEEDRVEGNEDALDSSDCSLDESDFSSSESTTEVSSEHSDWGSDNEQENEQQQTPATSSKELKRKSPKSKKRRNAADKCRERMVVNPGDITEQYIPSPWLSESIPRKSPYFPQIGDVLMYFKQGHQKYLDLVKERKAYKVNEKEQQWRRKNLKEPCMVTIMEIKFEIRPPRLCVLKLGMLNERDQKLTGERFTIKYHDMNDVVDFLVLAQTFNSYKGKHWKSGDRIRCQIDDCWWKGTVQKIVHHDAAKKSPFLSIHVAWDNGEKEFLSPWDLEALDNESGKIADGSAVSKEELKSCLYTPSSEEWNQMGRESECTRISEALEAIMSLAIAEPFNYPVDLTNYPEYMLDVEYPMDLNLIKARVDNFFYRRIAAIQRDIKYIYENAASFNRPKSDIVRNAKILTKLAAEIVEDTNKTKDDVSRIYHRLSENFAWSATDDSQESDDESADEETPRKRRASSRQSSASKSSPPNLNPKKWKKDCNLLLDEMVDLPFSEPFRTPVSAIEFPDYHRQIATPMDLSTVRESLHIGDYSNPLDFQKDVNLIFNNSREYNTNPNSKVLKMTTKLENWFDERIAGLIRDWRKTNRRLSMAKRKHKSKKLLRADDADPVPEYKGKGKGKGKGKSNRNVKNVASPQKRKRRQRYDPADLDDDDDDIDDSEEEETDNEDDSDFMSDSSPDKQSKVVKSHSGRVIRRPKFQDDEQKPCSSRSLPPPPAAAAPKRMLDLSDTNQLKEFLESPVKSEPQPSTSGISPTEDGRRVSGRLAKPPVRFRDEAVEEGRRTSDRATKSRTNYREMEEEDEAQVSAAAPPSTETRRTTGQNLKRVRKESEDDSEDEPLVKRAALSKRKADIPYQPPKAQESSESEDDKPLRPSSKGRRSVDPAHHQDSSEDEDDLPLKRSRKTVSKKAVKSKKPKSAEESDDSEEGMLTSRKRRPLPAPSLPKSRTARDAVDSEGSAADEPKKLSNKNVLRVSPRTKSRVPVEEEVRKSRRTQRKNYNEDESEHSSSERENRRPVRSVRKSVRKHHDSDASDFSEDEEEEMAKRRTTVTSRGRVCKPNPRII